jgi:hypothetical protein
MNERSPEVVAFLRSIENCDLPEMVLPPRHAVVEFRPPSEAELKVREYALAKGLIAPTGFDGATELTDTGLVALRESETADLPAANQQADAKVGDDQGGRTLPVTEPTRMTWQDAAQRLKRLREQGEPWTSQHKLAKAFGCSSRTINTAIKMTPELQPWATPKKGDPRAQGINTVVLDNAKQTQELQPEDAAAIREFIETASPTEKAWFLSLSEGDQLDFLDDPARHQKILGRKA